MAWVEMNQTHNFTRADRRRTTKYLEGKRYSVHHKTRDALVARGVAKAIPTPPRPRPPAGSAE